MWNNRNRPSPLHIGKPIKFNRIKLRLIRIFYLDNNHIGNQGIKLLTKSNLPSLSSLFIGLSFFYVAECQIENEGFKHMMKAKWPNLTRLSICT